MDLDSKNTLLESVKENWFSFKYASEELKIIMKLF